MSQEHLKKSPSDLHPVCLTDSPSHSRSCVLSGSVPVSLPDGVSRASKLMSSDGVSVESAAAEKLSELGSWGSRWFKVKLRAGATRRFLAPPPTPSDRARLVGGAKGAEGVETFSHLVTYFCCYFIR